jgi:hypothetical protein
MMNNCHSLRLQCNCLAARSVFAGLLFCGVQTAPADGTVIDKIYHPYVQALEHEIELRASIEDGGGAHSSDRQTWRLGYGQSITDNWFGELYLIGEQSSGESFRLEQYELEALWQITEQGEYAVDAGMLFEYEQNRSVDSKEFSTGLLLEKELAQRWTVTANLYAIYEFGSDINNEFETAAALQLRFRYSRAFEPALEIYKSEDIVGIGPAIMGAWGMGQARQLRWEAGLISGIDRDTPDRTFRLLLEYEF